MFAFKLSIDNVEKYYLLLLKVNLIVSTVLTLLVGGMVSDIYYTFEISVDNVDQILFVAIACKADNVDITASRNVTFLYGLPPKSVGVLLEVTGLEA